jgi:nitroreductase
MNVTDALNSRFTCRAFKPDALDRETVVKILDAAIRAPSWGNTQPWEIFVADGHVLDRIRQGYMENFKKGVPSKIETPAPQNWPPYIAQRTQDLLSLRFSTMGIDPNDKEAMKAFRGGNFRFFGAPVVVYLCMDKTLSTWSVFDLGSLSQSIMLAAQEYNLGSAVAAMLVTYPDLIRETLGISKDLSIIIGIALGYCDMQSPQNKFKSSRRSIQDVVHFSVSMI